MPTTLELGKHKTSLPSRYNDTTDGASGTGIASSGAFLKSSAVLGSALSPNKRNTIINQKKDLANLIYNINDTLGIQGPVHIEDDLDDEGGGKAEKEKVDQE